MGFIVYDLTFLIVFTIFVSIFLYLRRKNLKREGILFLYRTQWGMKLIDRIGKKYQKTLYYLSYLVIGVGYLLMIGGVYFFGKVVYIYIVYPQIVESMKVPPIMPLVPYLTELPSLSFLPPFYFTYWIIILAVIAITHEFAHGIFMRRYNIKIKSTGFGFLGPFLAAFVEQDEESMTKKGKFEQLSVLSAGTFANILTAILFFVILVIFFSYFYTPNGIVFSGYAYSIVPLSMITSIDGNSVNNITFNQLNLSIHNSEFSTIKANNLTFIIKKDFLNRQLNTNVFVALYDDAPAVKANLTGAISKINDVYIKSMEDLSTELSKYSPGDIIKINTIDIDKNQKEFEITLGKNPLNEKAWLGIGFSQQPKSGISGIFNKLISLFKKENVFYTPVNELSVFIYNFLWWGILISVSVALVNMLPVGIFDGGRVFYLTVLFFTKNKKISERAYSWMVYFFLFLLFVLMIFWAKSFF